MSRAREGADLIAAAREQVESGARLLRTGTALFAVGILVFGGLVIAGDPALRWSRLTVVAVYAGTIVWLLTVKRRRLARERAELDGATRRRLP